MSDHESQIRLNEYSLLFQKRIKSLTVVGAVSSAIWLGAIYYFRESAVVSLAAISGAIYILGTVADLKSTEMGLKRGAKEMNPLLPEYPDIKRLYSPGELAKDSIALVVGMVFPQIGISVGVDRAKLARDNFKKIEQIDSIY